MAGFDFSADPFKGSNVFGGGSRKPTPEYRRPLDPDEAAGIGQQALDAGKSGVSQILGALDKPGQAARGLIAGKGVQSLKHLIPFSHAMGITTDRDDTTGRDLTDQYGITSRGDKGWGAWGAGLAADIATDPLTYTTFGAKHALTGAGKLVAKTGALRGWSGKAMLQGYHGTESALTSAGRTASDIDHLVDQGKRIASSAAEAAVPGEPGMFRAISRGPNGHVSLTGATADIARKNLEDHLLRGGFVKPGEKVQSIVGQLPNAGTLQAGQPLGSLVRIGLPFGGPGVNIGTGKTAQKIAGGLDAAGDYLKFGNPVGRAVGSLFDSTRHGATGAMTQRGAAEYLDPALRALKEEARFDRGNLIKEVAPLVSKAGVHGESEITNAARSVAEGVGHQVANPGLVGDVGPAAARIRSTNDRRIAEAMKAGAPIKDAADDYVDYVPRQAFKSTPGGQQMGGKGGKGGKPQPLMSTTSGANIGRKALYRNIPGGSGRIGNWYDRFSGFKDRSQRAAVASAVHSDLVDDLIKGGGLPTLTPDLMAKFDKKAAAFTRELRHSDPAYRSVAATATTDAVKGKPFFSPDIVADETRRGLQHVKTVANSKTVTSILGDIARPMVQGSDMIGLDEAMTKLGLETYGADRNFLSPGWTGKPMEGALVNMYKALAKQGAGKVDPFLMGKISTLRKRVGRYGITPAQFKELAEAHAGWNAPEEIKSTLRGFDGATNAFKALAYPIWLPSHVRNAGTAFVNNLRHGVGLRDYAEQAGVMTGRGARDLSAIHPSLAGLAPTDQIAKLREMQYGHANIFGGHGMNEEIAGNVKTALAEGKRFTPNVPGSDLAGTHGNIAADAADLTLKQGLLGSLGAAAKTIRHPTQFGQHLGIKGVAGAATDALPAVAAGRKVGTNVEDFFRGALFNKLSREGRTGAEAAGEINKLHFDYDALTGFEKNVMRRGVPFYTYMRKNLPLQLDTLAHNPGIAQAQSKPFNQEDPDGKGYVPSYMNSGYAMGLGPEADGKRQYISKLGLPAEEAFERLRFKNGLPDIPNTVLSYAGGMNPLLKAPLEQIFNKQFYSQRKLSDLHASNAASGIGKVFGDDNPQLLSQIFANSPATRFISSADKLADTRMPWGKYTGKLGEPRKSIGQTLMNMATGVKVTDVDTEKQRAIDTREALRGIIDSHPNLSQYQSFYVKPENAAKLTPEEIELMRAWTAQQAAAKEYKKQQKAVIRN